MNRIRARPKLRTPGISARNSPSTIVVEMAARFVTVCADMPSNQDPLLIAGREFRSRLLLGTGKFSSNATMAAALDASGCEIVTVALRRADLSGKHDPFADILDFI